MGREGGEMGGEEGEKEGPPTAKGKMHSQFGACHAKTLLAPHWRKGKMILAMPSSLTSLC